MKKVKFVQPIAGLEDPNRAALDVKYEKIRERAKLDALKASREYKATPVERLIAEHKRADRYDDVCRGFKRDFSYKIGDEALIPAEIAKHWEEDGICMILEDQKKAA